jgi:hypothetical protein
VTTRRWVALVAATYAYFAAALLLIARDSLGIEFFFDEAWRSDFIRSASLFDRYTTNNAPIPLGWLGVMRAGATFLPDGFRGLRVTSLLVAAPGFVCTTAIVHHVFDDAWGHLRAWCYGIVASSVLLVTPAVHLTASYLNDYLFQMGATAAVVLLWLRFVRHDRTADGGALLAGVVLLPVVTISGMFVLPAIFVDLALRIRAGRAAALRMWQLVAGFAASGAVAVAIYLLVYRSVADEGIESFWGRVSLSQNGWGAVGAIPEKVWQNGLPGSTLLVDGGLRVSVVAQLALVALAVVGLVAIGRACPRYPIVLGSSLVVSAIASAAVGWPLTPERVNLPIWWMVWLAVGVAIVVVLDTALRRPPIVVVVAAAGVLALFPVHHLAGTPYAVGLYGDLQVVRASPVPGNVVLSYHPMSHFYSHDGLVNETTPGRSFAVVADPWDDDSLLDDPDGAAIAAGWEPGDAVWCVVPFEYGMATLDACALTLPGLERAVEHRGTRALVVGWLPTGA